MLILQSAYYRLVWRRREDHAPHLTGAEPALLTSVFAMSGSSSLMVAARAAAACGRPLPLAWHRGRRGPAATSRSRAPSCRTRRARSGPRPVRSCASPPDPSPLRRPRRAPSCLRDRGPARRPRVSRCAVWLSMTRALMFAPCVEQQVDDLDRLSLRIRAACCCAPDRRWRYRRHRGSIRSCPPPPSAA